MWKIPMNEEMNFEKSFTRLEAILDRMNSGNIALEESLKLYEEADQLISTCTLKLNAAEAKIEMLIKKRDGELEVDGSNHPISEAFQV